MLYAREHRFLLRKRPARIPQCFDFVSAKMHTDRRASANNAGSPFRPGRIEQTQQISVFAFTERRQRDHGIGYRNGKLAGYAAARGKEVERIRRTAKFVRQFFRFRSIGIRKAKREAMFSQVFLVRVSAARQERTVPDRMRAIRRSAQERGIQYAVFK